MKLTLLNFKCWKEKTLELGSVGVSLISGKSGVGKTTILEAVLFVLFGIGTKVVTHGNTSCKVTLEVDGHTIVRTKRPNRLIFDIIHEDDEAQSIINKKFGDNFFMTNYIKQNSYNSFVLLSPLEKLSFLEKFALGDQKLKEIKEKLKILIRERNNRLVEIESQIEIMKILLSEKEIPETIESSIKNISIENQDKIFKKYQKKLDVKESRHSKLRKGIDFLKEKLSATLVINKSIEITQQELKLNSEKISKIKIYNIKNLEDKYEEKKSLLSRFLKNKDFLFAEKKLQTDKETYNSKYEVAKDSLNKKIGKLKKKLWNDMSKEECIDQIQDYKTLIKDIDRLNEYKDKLSKVNIDDTDFDTEIKILEEKIRDMKHKLEIMKFTYKCPKCSSGLKMVENVLVFSSEKINSDVDYKGLIKECRTTKDSLHEKSTINIRNKNIRDSILSNINDIEQRYDMDISQKDTFLFDLKECEDYLENNLETDKKVQILEERLENLYIDLKEDIVHQEDQIKIMRKDIGEDINLQIDEEKIRYKITEIKNQINISRENSELLDELVSKNKSYSKRLEEEKEEFINKFKIIVSVDKIQESISKYESEYKEISDELNKLRKDIQNIDKYIRYLTEVNEFEKLRNKIKNLKEDEFQARKKLTSATTIREKIQEAESITIYNIIQSINNNIQHYLEIFFDENPMTVSLQSFKEDKKHNKKPQINLEIDYKGMECDINMLSGGELQRLIVAFTLALSEMSLSPLILLDECTSNLDQDLTNTVVNGIRKYFSDKKVLIIAHQVVSGLFDNVIKI